MRVGFKVHVVAIGTLFGALSTVALGGGIEVINQEARGTGQAEAFRRKPTTRARFITIPPG